MIDCIFPVCAYCNHMTMITVNGVKEYYCPLVVDDIPNGFIHPTVDAEECVKKGRYSKRK